MSTIRRVRVLQGHSDTESAYLVNDYPYGFSLRCRIRFWIDTSTKGAKKGQQRFASQTTNPKQGNKWNKPKYSTYSVLAIMFEDEDSRIRHWGVSPYGITPESDAIFRLSGIYDQLTAGQRTAYDILVRYSKRFADPWIRWKEKVQAVAKYQHDNEGKDPETVNGVWTDAQGARYYLGRERDLVALLHTARQHPHPPTA